MSGPHSAVIRAICKKTYKKLPGLLDSLTTCLYDTAGAVLEGATPVDSRTATTLQATLDILHDVLRHVSEVVRNALQMKKGGGGGGVAQDAEELLLTNKPLTDLCPTLIHLICNEDNDIRDIAVKCLSLLVQLYGGENQAALEQPNMVYYTEALTKADARRQKVLLRIIKRLITTNKDLLECVRTNGQQLTQAIQQLAKTASSHADMAVANLASEIIKTLAT